MIAPQLDSFGLAEIGAHHFLRLLVGHTAYMARFSGNGGHWKLGNGDRWAVSRMPVDEDRRMNSDEQHEVAVSPTRLT